MAGISKLAVAALAAAAIPILTGCGDSRSGAAVSGRVTLDGRDLPQGMVRFVPIEGTPGQKLSAVVEAGRFHLDPEFGPAKGRYRIEIESTDMGGLGMDDEDALLSFRNRRSGRMQTLRVPPTYNSRSTLTVDVGEGSNEFRFELRSD
ncbi:MAG: hypothetical protein NXI32_15980 [bacterium]|nr:hypothetical protein [bacterium]